MCSSDLKFEDLPRYDIVDEGPDHAKRFAATVFVAGAPHGRGEGRTKKAAEQAAAREAWDNLHDEADETDEADDAAEAVGA